MQFYYIVVCYHNLWFNAIIVLCFMFNSFHIHFHFRQCIAWKVCQSIRMPPEDCRFDENTVFMFNTNRQFSNWLYPRLDLISSHCLVTDFIIYRYYCLTSSYFSHTFTHFLTKLDKKFAFIFYSSLRSPSGLLTFIGACVVSVT